MNKHNLFTNALAQSAHIQVNSILIQKVGINAAIVAGELVSQQHYHAMNLDLTDKGYFWQTYKRLEDNTCLTRNQIAEAVKKLETVKIVSTYPDYDEEGKRIKYYKVDTLRIDDIVRNGDGSVSMNTIRSDAFMVYNKALAKRIGPAPTIVLSDLYTSYMNTAELNNLIDDEWFCMVSIKQAKKLGITRQILTDKNRGYITQLIKFGLISKKTMGDKNKTFIKINFDKLYEMLDYGSKAEYTSGSFFYAQNTTKEEVSEVERVTKLILDHVKEISGKEWEFNYEKMARIEKILEEGYTEDQLIQIIDHMYKYYGREDKKSELFEFNNLVGVPSKVAQWLKKIETDNEKEEEKLYAEKVAYTIYNKMLEISDGKIKYEIDSNKIDLIRKRLAEELSEEELIEHATSRYNYLKEHGYDAVKNCSFNKLFGSKCFDDIQTVRNIKLKESAPKKNIKFKEKFNNNGTRDGVISKPFSKESAEFMKKELEAGNVF